MDCILLVLVSFAVAQTCTATSTNADLESGSRSGSRTCECPWTQDDFTRLTAEVAALRADVDAMRATMAANPVQRDQSNAIPEPSNVVGNIVRIENDESPTPPPRPPKIEGYVYATCKPMPNSALTTELFQPITGVINMKQNATGGPLFIDVFMYGFQSSEGSKHGFHVHTYGDLKDGCQSTGGHYNPFSKDHGGPGDENRHVGDFGNLVVGGNGLVNVALQDPVANLIAPHSIIGRALVIHADEDDLGRGSFPDSRTTGHAGARLACCVIGVSEQ